MVRNFTVIDCEQRSDAWVKARLGRLTASRAHDICGVLRSGGEPAARRNLRVDLVLERLMGVSQERGFVSGPMQDGLDREPLALAYYEAMTGTLVQRVGFVAHDTLRIGCSPDGVVHDFEGGVECKCPTPAIHLAFLRTGKIAPEYLTQLAHAIYITQSEWWDFVSFQPQFPEPLQFQAQRVRRSDVDLVTHEKLVRAFLDEVDAEEQAVRTMADLRGQLQASLA